VQRKAGAVQRPREGADRSRANEEADGAHGHERSSGAWGQKDARPVRAPPLSRHIPASVRRAVWARDGGRCAFVAPDGRRCGETAFLEFHHVRPYARGGPATVENIELRCRAHNGYEAKLALGGGEEIEYNTRPDRVRTRPRPSSHVGGGHWAPG
jgi:hypothetical protein